MARPGRKKVVGESVYLRLDPDVAEKLIAFVQNENRKNPWKTSKNSVINHAIKVFLEQKRPLPD